AVLRMGYPLVRWSLQMMTQNGGKTAQFQGDHERCWGSTTKFGGMWILSLRQTCRQLGQSSFGVLIDALRSAFCGRQPDLTWLYESPSSFTPCERVRLLKDSGVESVLLPPRSPHLNAHCERFVRSIKEEALAQMVMLGERSLYYAIQQYLAHYHYERHHQGLDNHLIAREEVVGCPTGQVVRRERLGGLLSYYHREAA